VGVRLRLFSTMVDSVLSHAAKMWAVQFVAAAVAGSTRDSMCGSGSAAEGLHMGYLCCLLSARQTMPNGAVLLATGERPLWASWLQRAGRLWNRLTAAPPGSMLHTVFGVSCQLGATEPATLSLARKRNSQQPAGHWHASGPGAAPPALLGAAQALHAASPPP
jgi:hypothetical protein